MNPGELRERIAVYAVARADDELGGAAGTETLKGALWAKVRTPAARDGVLAMQGAEVRTHEVVCRACPAAPAAGDLILWAGTRLRVRGTRPDPKSGFVAADCADDRP